MLLLWLLACHPADVCDPVCKNAQVCVDGACERVSWSLEIGVDDLHGGIVDPEVGAMSFGADYLGHAWVEAPDGARVDVTLTDADHVTVAGDRGSLDGDGELTDAERRALVALDDAGLAEGAGIAAMFLACGREEIPPIAAAALLAPFQASLKYMEPNRVDAARAVAARSSCVWMADPAHPLGDEGPGDLVRFGQENPVPNVYGYFPFDGVGSVEAGLPRAAGDALGPCEALCRGACGADCDPDDCTATPIFVCEEQDGVFTTNVLTGVLQSCGTADGCRAHDDCFDTCNQVEGCGTWSAARCRRGCDLEAAATWGVETGALWATGHGPKDSAPLEFQYLDFVGVPDPLTCPAGTTVPFHVAADPPYPVITPSANVTGSPATSHPVIDGVVASASGVTVDAYFSYEHTLQPTLRVDITAAQRERVTVRGSVAGPFLDPLDWVWFDAYGETHYTMDGCTLRVQKVVDGVSSDLPSLAEGAEFTFEATPPPNYVPVAWTITPTCTGGLVQTVYGSPNPPTTAPVEVTAVGVAIWVIW